MTFDLCSRIVSEKSEALSLLEPQNVDKWVKRYFHWDMPKWVYIEWQKYADTTNYPRYLVEAPMGHAKTTYFSILYPIWRICRDRQWTCLLGGASLDIPKDCVRIIEQHLQTNELLIADYGAFYSPRLKWTETMFYVLGAIASGPPTMRVTAVYQTIAGKRAGELLFDDLVDNKNSDTEFLRAKTARWFTLMFLSRGLPDAPVRGVGTEYNQFTLYQDIINKKLGQYSNWRTCVLVAESPENCGPHGELWPEFWPIDKLEMKKKEMGSVAYAIAFMNDPRAATGKMFKEKWLAECKYKIEPEGLVIGQGVDLASSLDEKANWFVIMTIGVDPMNETVYILDVYRAHLEFPDQVTAIRDFARARNPMAIGIDSEAYQVSMPQQLKSISALPIKPIRSGGHSKFHRLMSLVPLFEQGKIKLREDMASFIVEYLMYDPTSSASPDQLDALWYAIQATFPELHKEFLGDVLADERESIWEMRH